MLFVPVSVASGVLFDHRYSWELGRSGGGRGSQSTRRSAGGFIRLQSANDCTRLYKNVPVDSWRAYWPVWLGNQSMSPAIGAIPPTAVAAIRRQPMRRASMP